MYAAKQNHSGCHLGYADYQRPGGNPYGCKRRTEISPNSCGFLIKLKRQKPPSGGFFAGTCQIIYARQQAAWADFYRWISMGGQVKKPGWKLSKLAFWQIIHTKKQSKEREEKRRKWKTINMILLTLCWKAVS